MRLELELDPGIEAAMVSEYHSATSDAGGRSIVVGDLLSGEERQIVVRLSFPAQAGQEGQTARAQAVWTVDGVERRSDWQELRFSFAGEAACDAEQRDNEVMHWVGLHHAERAQREATEQSLRGELDGARRTIQRVIRHLTRYAGDDAALRSALQALTAFEARVSAAPMVAADAKEQFYQTKRRSRGESDHRSGPEEPR